MSDKSCESVTTGRRLLLKRAAIACGTIALLVSALVGWRARERRDFLSTLQSQLAAQGAVLKLGMTKDSSMTGDSLVSAKLELGSELTILADRVAIRQGLLAPTRVVVDSARFMLRGSPAALWDQWSKTRAWRNLPIVFSNSSVEYQDPSLGHITIAGATLEHRADEELLRASQLSFNGKRWNDVALAISHPKAIIRIGLGEDSPAAPQLEVRYVPSQGKAAEWMLSVPSQPLGTLLARLGAGEAPPGDKSRVAGTASAIIFDDATKPSRANLALVVDNWFVPAWPEASAFTGKSGSIGARLELTADRSSWKLTRVEVAAAIFSLTGTGTLTLGEPSHLSFDVKGTRNCAQLAAHLPASGYRERVKTFLEQAKSAEEQTVELGLNVDLSLGVGGHSNFNWHLAAGCGLDELNGQGTFGGS